MTTYRLVPLDGDTGAQEVDGKRAAFEIAQEIANRERAGVHVYPVGGEGRTLVEPTPIPLAAFDIDGIRAALEGESNDAEHDALAGVADALGIEWTAFEDRTLLPSDPDDPDAPCLNCGAPASAHALEADDECPTTERTPA